MKPRTWTAAGFNGLTMARFSWVHDVSLLQNLFQRLWHCLHHRLLRQHIQGVPDSGDGRLLLHEVKMVASALEVCCATQRLLLHEVLQVAGGRGSRGSGEADVVLGAEFGLLKGTFVRPAVRQTE
jgi:hypothetical protein